jgi:phosphoribosyl 1,2-cyclic phosphodiesterase
MTLTFLGTRGEIDIRSRRHRRHSSLLVQHGGSRIMIDCGADWLGAVKHIAPTAIVLTHAHADHAAGLASGAPCPVYATGETWDAIRRFPISEKHRLPLNKACRIDGVEFTAVPVAHSIRAPAVGLRVAARGQCFFYVPDVAKLDNAARTLCGAQIYIGDGATLTRSMVRRKGGTVIGHAPVTDQLAWCRQAGIRRAVFTHCGSAIVRAEHQATNAKLWELGRKQGVEARLACDGDRLYFPDPDEHIECAKSLLALGS